MSKQKEELNIEALEAQAEATETTEEVAEVTEEVTEVTEADESVKVERNNREIAAAIAQRDPERAREIARARLAQMTPEQIAALRAAKAAKEEAEAARIEAENERLAQEAELKKARLAEMTPEQIAALRAAKIAKMEAEASAQAAAKENEAAAKKAEKAAKRKAGKKNKRGISYESKQAFTGFMFVLPWFIGFLLFFAVPCFQSLQFAFSKVSVFDNYKCEWYGLGNFKDILTSGATYLQALLDTLTDLAVNVPVILIFSLFVAVLLNRKFVGRGLVRGIFFLPVIVTTGVVMTTFNSTSDASAVMEGDVGNGVLFEVANAADFLGELGLNESLTNYMSMVADRIFNVVWDSGIQILLFLAALQGISPSLYEASDVEGATAWETFWLITFPNVAPIILVNIVYTIVDTFGDTSNAVMVEIDKYINSIFNFGAAAAASWAFFLVILVIIGVVFGLFQLIGRAND